MISKYVELLNRAKERSGCVVLDHDKVEWTPISPGPAVPQGSVIDSTIVL